MKGFFKRFFKGISWVQILAGALAAGTVFLLSSRLGTAGTIIGAVVASACSTFASQLYQNILNESQKAIKTVAQEAKKGDGTDSDDAAGSGSGSGDVSAARRTAGMVPLEAGGAAATGASAAAAGAPVTRLSSLGSTASLDKTAVHPPVSTVAAGKPATPSDTAVWGGANAVPVDETSVMAPVGAGVPGADGEQAVPPAYQPGTGIAENPADAADDTAGAASHAATQPDPARKKKRIAIIVSVALSLLIVAITAGIILLATNGKGTGNTLTTQTTTQTDDDTSTKSDTTPSRPDKGKPSTDSGSSTDSGTSSGTDSGTSSDSGSSSTDSGTDSGSSSDSGSGSSSGTDSDSGSSSGSTGSDSDSSTDSGSGTGSDSSSDGSGPGSDSSSSDSSKSKTGTSSNGSSSGSTGSSTSK